VTIFKKLSLFSNRWQALSGNKLNRFGIIYLSAGDY